jgi:hypothetical protein
LYPLSPPSFARKNFTGKLSPFRSVIFCRSAEPVAGSYAMSRILSRQQTAAAAACRLTSAQRARMSRRKSNEHATLISAEIVKNFLFVLVFKRT